MMKELRYFLESLPGYGLFSIAAKEINLIKTQKIALALILLYPVIVIGTLGAAFSGTQPLAKVEVAVYAPQEISGFDTGKFMSKLEASQQIKPVRVSSEEEVHKSILERKAKLGIIIREPEPTQGRYVLDLITDNSNINRSALFFQVAKDSIRGVGFDLSRELLGEVWENLTDIKQKLKTESGKIDELLAKLDDSEKQLLDLNKSINQIDVEEMRQKLNKQESSLKELGPKIDSFGQKISQYSGITDEKIKRLAEIQSKIRDYKDRTISTKNAVERVKAELDKQKELISRNPSLLSAYNQVASIQEALSQAVTDLEQTNTEIENAKLDLAKAKTELAGTQQQITEIKSGFSKAHQDLNFFNDQLNYLGRTVDKLNEMTASALTAKKKVQNDLTNSRKVMDSFVAKLDELNAISPQFLANPIVINKVVAYDVSNLETVTPMALVLLLLLTTILLTGVSFVVERSEGAYTRMVLSPKKKLEIFAGKVLGQLIFALIEAGIIILIALFVFGVKLGGVGLAPKALGEWLSPTYYAFLAKTFFSASYLASIAEIMLGLSIVSFSFICLGLFIANYTRIQSTTILAGLLLVIPMIFISGMLIPIELMSDSIQQVSTFQPLTLGITIATEMILKGAHLASMGKEVAMLLMPAIIFFGFTLANRNLGAGQ